MRVLPLLLLLACEKEAPRDATLNGVLAAAEDGPRQAADLINGMSDPAQRQAMLVYLLQERPQTSVALCPLLEGDDLVQTCKLRAGRAHLWTSPTSAGKATASPSSGPAGWHLDVPDDTPSRFGSVAPQVGPCADAVDLSSCASRAAVRQARGGDGPSAAALCEAIADPRTAAECRFLSAEQLATRHGADAFADAADLCIAAGEFRPRCFSHLVLKPAEDVPAADALGADWSAEVAYAAAASAWWSRIDPALGVVAAERYWSNATARSMAKARVVTGDLLDHVPASQHAQVRAAAAWRMMMDEPVTTHDLAGWVDVLQTALAMRSSAVEPQTFARHSRRTAPFGSTIDLWSPEIAAEPGAVATIYMGTSRRVTVADPADDLAICVLEAAARLPTPDALALIESARSSDQAAVRWTAERLERVLPARDGGPTR